MLGFVSHTVIVATTQVCHQSSHIQKENEQSRIYLKKKKTLIKQKTECRLDTVCLLIMFVSLGFAMFGPRQPLTSISR